MLNDVPHPSAKLHRIGARDVLAGHPDTTRGRLDQAVDHLHRGRLPAPRWANEHHERATRDIEREFLHGDRSVGVALRHSVQPDERIFGTVAAVALHAATLTDGCLVRNDWLCLEYLQSRGGELASATVQHVYLTVASLLLGIALALPLAVLTHRSRPAQGFVLGASTAIYTVPSIAMFSLLLPLTGLNASTVIIGLALYSLTILVRNILAGLDAVPADVLDAAKGMGYGSARILLRVQLPLAMPTIFAGLRVAAVSTVALVTVGFLVGYGGLGNLIYEGLTSFFKAQVLTASVLCVLLAVAADALLFATERLATPWRRARS